MRRLRDPQLLEEDLRHLLVPVLSGVDDDLVDSSLPERGREGSRLDELGPVPDHGEDAHPPLHYGVPAGR
jgi:hypothetical protein